MVHTSNILLFFVALMQTDNNSIVNKRIKNKTTMVHTRIISLFFVALMQPIANRKFKEENSIF